MHEQLNLLGLGFPENQPTTHGMPLELAQKVADAYRTRGDIRAAAGDNLTPAIERIVARLKALSLISF